VRDTIQFTQITAPCTPTPSWLLSTQALMLMIVCLCIYLIVLFALHSTYLILYHKHMYFISCVTFYVTQLYYMYIFVLIFEYVDDFVSINAENICQKKKGIVTNQHLAIFLDFLENF